MYLRKSLYYFLFALIGVVFPLLGWTQGHTTFSANTPRLVVGVVIEDFNPDYIDRYWDKFEEGGFRRLFSRGFVCANHHYDNLVQRPSVNLATLSTGSNPSRHGIINDQWIDRLKNKAVNAISDEFYTSVGSDSKEGERSAMQLMTPTLGDQLKLVTKGRARVFSVALNDVAAVLTAGHAADGAYWLDKTNGKMISSSYYVETFPKWAFDFNGFKLADGYINQDWSPLKDYAIYTESIQNPNAKGNGFLGKYNAFPYNLSRIRKEMGGGYSILKTTPFGNDLIKDFTLQLIPKEQLGYDLVPDMLTIVLSSMGDQRYAFGSFSIEMEDTYLRMDKALAELLKYLEGGFGTENILVYLTGATSISYPAELLKEKFRMTTGIFNPESAVALLRAFLTIKYGEGDWVQLFANQQIYLDHELIEKKKINLKDMQLNVASFLNQFQGIAFAKAACELEVDNHPDGPLEPFQNNYNIKRSGDVLIRYQEGWQPKDKFNPVDYTDHDQVPLVWYGAGIQKGTTVQKTSATDIVPTVAAFLGIAPPPSASGRVISELFKP